MRMRQKRKNTTGPLLHTLSSSKTNPFYRNRQTWSHIWMSSGRRDFKCVTNYGGEVSAFYVAGWPFASFE